MALIFPWKQIAANLWIPRSKRLKRPYQPRYNRDCYGELILAGYHRRSLVETKMHCIKLLGDKLSARNFQSQVNEIHARMAVLNKFTDLGRPHTRVVT